MKTLDETLNKKPEIFKEKLESIWYDVTHYYPSRIRDGWWATKRFFRNLKRYWGILWEDNDFDHGYMENLLFKKLTFMADYFRTARLVEGAEKTYNQINLAIRVGRIAFDENPEEMSPESYGGNFGLEYLGYVNTKNCKRFWPTIDPSFFENQEIKMYLITDLRKIKARRIFYKILSQYSETWWD